MACFGRQDAFDHSTFAIAGTHPFDVQAPSRRGVDDGRATNSARRAPRVALSLAERLHQHRLLLARLARTVRSASTAQNRFRTVLSTTPDATLKRKLERVARDSRLRQPRTCAARQRQLSQLYRSGSSLCSVERLRDARAFVDAASMVFSNRGCVNYRGLFRRSRRPHRSRAASLLSGEDVYVGGVPAYSTLGYFNDPMPSTVIRYSEIEIARLDFSRARASGCLRQG